MALDFLMGAIAAPLVKQLVKLAFGEGVRTEVGQGIVDWLAGKVTAYGAKKAELSVVAIADQVIGELEPLFEGSRLSRDDQRNVAEALGRTLGEVDVAALVIAGRFKLEKLLPALEASRPAAQDELDPSAYGLYRQALAGIAAAFCRVGSKLPSFTEGNAKATLHALDELAHDIGEVLAGIFADGGRGPKDRGPDSRS